MAFVIAGSQNFRKYFTQRETMMKKTIFSLALLGTLAVPAAMQAYPATQTMEGVVSDTMCGGGKHMMAGKPDAECIRECVKDGGSYALVVGGKVYTLTGKAQTIAPFAGKKVKVEGDVKGNTLTVTSIHEAADSMPGMKM